MNLFQSFLTATTATALMGLVSLPAQAAVLRFGTSGIQFSTDTTVDFTFQGSNNFYRSILSVFYVGEDDVGNLGVDQTSRVDLFEESKQSDNGSAGGWLSTCGSADSAVAGCTNSFTFKAGLLYTFGLINFNGSSPALSPLVYSTSAFNPAIPNGQPANALPGGQQALFGSAGSATDGVLFPNPGDFTFGDPFAGVTIAFEDGGYDGDGHGYVVPGGANDRDFNDFRVFAKVREAEEIPVPPSLGGLLLVSALASLRRRKQAQAEPEKVNVQ